MDRTPAVYLELLFRPGVRDEFRREALTAWPRRTSKPELDVLVNAIRTQDESAATEESVAFDLARLLTAMPMPNCRRRAPNSRRWPSKGHSATTRQIGFVALLAADGAIDKVWRHGHEVGRRAARLRRGGADGPRSGAAGRTLPEGEGTARPDCRRTWRRRSATGRP